MLDVPIEEILRLKSGELTLEDAMGRHMIQLERKQSNLAAAQGMCAQIRDSRSQLDTLDADRVLASMEQQEQEGTKFMNVKRNDRVRRYIGPVVGAVIIVALMVWIIGMFAPVIHWAVTAAPEEALPLPMVIMVIMVIVVFFKLSYPARR